MNLGKALKKNGLDFLLKNILKLLPEGQPFYEGDDLSDMPTKFFVGEMVREKIFQFFGDEIPYHTTVVVQEFKEKLTLIKIRAEIIVQRETQKGIILGNAKAYSKKIIQTMEQAGYKVQLFLLNSALSVKFKFVNILEKNVKILFPIVCQKNKIRCAEPPRNLDPYTTSA
jgi:GTPase Era involved in 16S rRNA processing